MSIPSKNIFSRAATAVGQTTDYRYVKSSSSSGIDHCFQKSGFDKNRLFYTQEDVGLWQCPTPCHQKTYDNEENVRACLIAQGFTFGEKGELILPDESELKMKVPSDLVPLCPKCGKPMRYNLRGGNWFVQDEGWYAAQKRYEDYLLVI